MNQSSAQALSAEDVTRVIDPDMIGETFKFGTQVVEGETVDREWKMQPLQYHFEKLFRKHAYPMLAIMYKPYEVGVRVASEKFYSDTSPSFTQAVFDAENLLDDRLTPALTVILMAQDKTINEKWVESNAVSVEQVRGIVMRQLEVNHLMDQLGESSVERLNKLAFLMGVQIDLVTLKQLWKRLSAQLSAKIMKLSTIADNAIGQFTETSSTNSTKNSLNSEWKDIENPGESNESSPNPEMSQEK